MGDKSVEELKTILRKRDDAEAQCEIGKRYAEGNGVDKNLEEAVKWFRKAADRENIVAQRLLADAYYYGNGVAQNFEEAVKWFRKSADKGDAEAQKYLGWCYQNGQGVAQDINQAVAWYRKAAEQGEAYAQNNLGLCYDQGQGVEQDYEQAAEWYRKAADQGDADAQNNLGLCYQNGQGVEQDYEQAVEWYRKAAEHGNARAQRRLGDCYYNGQGVEQDYEQAVEWFRKSAERGYASAQAALGFCYEDGWGVEKKPKEAVKWYRKAADQGNADGQFRLGWCYYTGEGIAYDVDEAKKWISKAAEQGHEEAQKTLSEKFPKNAKNTKFWNVSVSKRRDIWISVCGGNKNGSCMSKFLRYLSEVSGQDIEVVWNFFENGLKKHIMSEIHRPFVMQIPHWGYWKICLILVKARQCRHPATGQMIDLPPQRKIKSVFRYDSSAFDYSWLQRCSYGWCDQRAGGNFGNGLSLSLRRRFVVALCKRSNTDLSLGARFFDEFLAHLTCTFRNDGSFTWKGVGAFQYRNRCARDGWNPATGESIRIPAKRWCKFKPAPMLAKAVLGK